MLKEKPKPIHITDEAKSILDVVKAKHKEGAVGHIKQVEDSYGAFTFKFSQQCQEDLESLDPKSHALVLQMLIRMRINPDSHVRRIDNYPVYFARAGTFAIMVDMKRELLSATILKIAPEKELIKEKAIA
jgi:mRNA-degrading endonuclease RelE of RelBE toxin-antitoxin system